MWTGQTTEVLDMKPDGNGAWSAFMLRCVKCGKATQRLAWTTGPFIAPVMTVGIASPFTPTKWFSLVQ